MRKTFEEKYDEKLKSKVSGVEFSEVSLSETITDIKNGVDHLNDIIQIGPEEKKFECWLEREKEKGLVDFKISRSIEELSLNGDCLNIEYTGSINNRESFFKELNDMNQAIEEGKGIPITNL